MPRYKSSNKAETSSGSQFQTLALFIILLSFFIVLNSISTFEEEKIKPVLQSIEATFADRVIRNDLAPSVTEDPAQATENGTVYDHLDALFQSQFKKIDLSARTDHEKGIFYTELPYQTLERAVMDIKPHHISDIKKTGSFLSLLKTLMLNNDNQLRLDMVVYSSQENMRSLSKSISTLAQKLEAQGIPTTHIGIGIQESSPKNNRNAFIIIRGHTPYSATGATQ